MFFAVSVCFGKRFLQCLDQFTLVLDRHLTCFDTAACSRAIDSQRLLQVTEDTHVVNDQAAYLVLENTISAGDSLHQRVIAHGLVEVERGEAGHVKAGDPHGAHEDDAQRIICILEFRLQVLI